MDTPPIDEPAVGIYVHYKHGDHYQVLTCGTNVDDAERYVVYASTRTGKVWIRSVADWNTPAVVSTGAENLSAASFQHVPRFTKVP